MLGIDTNVLIRYITQDNAAQAAIATDVIENQISANKLGYVTLISLVEITWVLASCYKVAREQVLDIVQNLLTSKQIQIERSDVAYLALRKCRAGKGDFSDAVIVAISEQDGCTNIVTFDKKAVSIGMTLLK
jgi:predicted nucleic-acid-binding protein